jgi:hypothetical protein
VNGLDIGCARFTNVAGALTLPRSPRPSHSTRLEISPPSSSNWEEAEPCEGPDGVPIMPIAECNT